MVISSPLTIKSTDTGVLGAVPSAPALVSVHNPPSYIGACW